MLPQHVKSVALKPYVPLLCFSSTSTRTVVTVSQPSWTLVRERRSRYTPRFHPIPSMMAKRKRSSMAEAQDRSLKGTPTQSGSVPALSPGPKGLQNERTQPKSKHVDPNPDTNKNILDGRGARLASPDGDERFDDKPASKKARTSKTPATPITKEELEESDSPLSDFSDHELEAEGCNKIKAGQKSLAKQDTKLGQFLDPEADVEEEVDEEELKEALSRPPQVNSSYLPLPWNGRLGYACLNTYLRYSNPPVFASRTCRIASILENRHPLKDPTQPPHPTKNRPDRDQPADIARGQAYVEGLGLANARDVVKMLRWNERYGIRLMRLSSEMFPFASHEIYGYKLAPFASETLAAVGQVAAQYGHRLTTHPGQFTQLGSPRKEVIENSIRDLDYHSEMLSLLKLPEQQDRDAVMILHMGGIFGDKAATLDRFRQNYKRLSQDAKNRLVLENDDMGWSVHDLLPICEEMNIPLVLDYHHHNIVFDEYKIREGTLDIMSLYDRIGATWTRKGITQKMHYSEPTPSAITARQRRKHNPRVATLPPCDPTMDLMIEAKDKEQAVFELMRTFKLPGFDTFADILPHQRNDENKPWKPPKKKKTPKKKKGDEEPIEEEPEPVPPPAIPDEEVGMGGPDGRVYWPPGMEEWLRPVKRVVKKKDEGEQKTPKKAASKKAATNGEGLSSAVKVEDASEPASEASLKSAKTTKTKAAAKPKKPPPAKKAAKSVPTPSTSDDGTEDEPLLDLTDASSAAPPPSKRPPPQRPGTQRQSGRAKKISYAEADDDDDDEI